MVFQRQQHQQKHINGKKKRDHKEMSAKNDAMGYDRSKKKGLAHSARETDQKTKNDWKKYLLNETSDDVSRSLLCRASTALSCILTYTIAQRGSVSGKKVHTLRFTQANILFIHLL